MDDLLQRISTTVDKYGRFSEHVNSGLTGLLVQCHQEIERLGSINYANSTEIYRLEQEVKRLNFIQQEFHNIEDVAEIRRLRAAVSATEGSK